MNTIPQFPSETILTYYCERLISIMEDSNLIACLYPTDRNTLAKDAIRIHEKSAQYIPALQDSKPTPNSRESTVSAEDDENYDENPRTQPGL